MLIDEIDVLKEQIATIVGNDFGRYSPYVQTAENFLIRELTGQVLFDLAESDADLRKHFIAVIAHKGYLEAIPFLDLIETESGFAVASNTNIAPASTKRVQDLIAGLEKRLSELIEDMLEWLETAPDEIQDAWKASKVYTLVNDNYVRSVREFRDYGSFPGSRLEWIRFRPKLTIARKLKIEPVISKELSEEIIEQLRDDDLSENNALILDDLRYALAAFANDDPATGESFVSRVRGFLIIHSVDFPAFAESEIYQAYQALIERDTTDDTIHFFGV
ncbi:MAG: hypothetical protein PF694_09265 [Bacteroidetes bacterium]|jgi:hypothetical protein|nr:hypothetical protein [Bacteroidota bacterium]